MKKNYLVALVAVLVLAVLVVLPRVATRPTNVRPGEVGTSRRDAMAEPQHNASKICNVAEGAFLPDHARHGSGQGLYLEQPEKADVHTSFSPVRRVGRSGHEAVAAIACQTERAAVVSTDSENKSSHSPAGGTVLAMAAADAPGKEAGVAAAGGARAELEGDPLIVELGRGVRLPAALDDTDTAMMSPEQAKAKKRLAESFEERVVASLDSGHEQAEQSDPLQMWEAARNKIDESYKALFGEEAYNRRLLHLSREALKRSQQVNP